jgi:hypothetical protein
MAPAEIGAMVVEAVRRERYFILAEPVHQPLIERRAADPTAFLEARLAGEPVV